MLSLIKKLPIAEHKPCPVNLMFVIYLSMMLTIHGYSFSTRFYIQFHIKYEFNYITNIVNANICEFMRMFITQSHKND